MALTLLITDFCRTLAAEFSTIPANGITLLMFKHRFPLKYLGMYMHHKRGTILNKRRLHKSGKDVVK